MKVTGQSGYIFCFLIEQNTLNVHCMPGTILSFGDKAINKTIDYLVLTFS